MAVVFVVFVVLRAMDRVFNKRVLDRMPNYQLMYMNVLWPIGVQVATVLMCYVYIIYVNSECKKKGLPPKYDRTFFLPGSKCATKQGKPYSQLRLSLFSFWDELNAVLTSLPAPYISLTMQSILTNLNVVWTVVISVLYLGSKYHQNHWAGCLLIVVSGLAAVTVELTPGTGESLGSYIDANGDSHTTSTLWYVIFIVGTIPAGISNCYKEKCLKKAELDIMYACLWSGYWQILWGFVMFPINWIRMPEPAQQNYPGETWDYMKNTTICFFGDVPDKNNVQDQACAAGGGSAAYWFLWYLVFNVLFNVLLLWLTKYMSATWATIGTVLCLDLTSIFSMSKVLMGDEAEPITLEQGMGLVIAAIAMWVYNIQDEEEVLFAAEGELLGENAEDESVLANARRSLNVSMNPGERSISFGMGSRASAEGRSQWGAPNRSKSEAFFRGAGAGAGAGARTGSDVDSAFSPGLEAGRGTWGGAKSRQVV